MSEELKALEITKDQLNGLLPKGLTTSMKCNIKIIEVALKELEVKREVIGDILTGNDEKKLKALEIIKEKQVNVELLMKTESAKDYNKYSSDANKSHNLGQKQYKLLKEVLL
ncbi:MAG: hypothetical protein J6S85_20815 [Methanobrevibacter sp.]|nr:hypothetical protein [Methanobrevibacter sp.]